MKKLLLSLLALAALALPEGALAQTVSQQPSYINPGQANDLGNGPQELKVVQGNANFSTSFGSGIGQTTGGLAATSVTLTATPTTAPCIGCLLSNTSNPALTTTTVPAGAFITAFNGVTQITMSTNVTIGTGATLSWGAACPAVPGAVQPVQASVGGDFPFFTQARICAYSPFGPGASVLPFAIGAH